MTSHIRFTTCPAPPPIAAAVRELWLLKDDGGLHAGLPKPYVELVVSLSGEHWWRAAPLLPEHRYVDAWVTPVQAGPRYARAVGRRWLIGARLEPWAATALFGPLPPGDGTPPPRLEVLVGTAARDLRAALLETSEAAERFALLAGWIEERVASARLGGKVLPIPVRRANVDDLARSVGASPRSLRRRFAAQAGLGPKHWLRLHRLDAVLRDLTSLRPDESLAEFADAHGFADQAHLSRELARFTGTSPSALRRRPAGLPPHLLPSK